MIMQIFSHRGKRKSMISDQIEKDSVNRNYEDITDDIIDKMYQI